MDDLGYVGLTSSILAGLMMIGKRKRPVLAVLGVGLLVLAVSS